MASMIYTPCVNCTELTPVDDDLMEDAESVYRAKAMVMHILDDLEDIGALDTNQWGPGVLIAEMFRNELLAAEISIDDDDSAIGGSAWV